MDSVVAPASFVEENSSQGVGTRFVFRTRKTRIIQALFFFYRGMIHPLLQIFGSMGQECRYTPSCSRYAQEAFTQYSFFKAFRLSLERLLRCHPWTSRSGFDPLPEEGRGPLSVVESRIRS